MGKAITTPVRSPITRPRMGCAVWLNIRVAITVQHIACASPAMNTSAAETVYQVERANSSKAAGQA